MSRAVLMLRIAALLPLVMATGYALDRWALRPLRCAHEASLGAATLQSPLTDNQTQRLARRIRADLEGCQCVSPPDAGIPTTLGTAAEAAGDLRAAIAEYQRALMIDRRPEIYLRLGLAQLDTRDRAAAIENIVRACAFDPARLSDIPYPEIRQETELRLRTTCGPRWIQ